MLPLIGFFALGLGAGGVGALLGLGGGIILVPALTLWFHVPIRAAVGTSLVAVIATSAGSGSLAVRQSAADVPLALRLEVATAAGALSGGLIGGMVPARVLILLFAAVVFGSAAYTVHKARQGSPGTAAHGDYEPRRWALGYAIASFAGLVSGLLGVGGGFIKVPTMHAVMGVPLRVATATSNFMVGITAAASVFVYLGRGDVRPLLTAVTVSGVFLGALAGRRIQPHVRVSFLRWALVLLLLGVGVQLVMEGL